MSILVRHPDNPVLSREQVPYPSSLVFNAGVARWQGRYAMLFRNDFGWNDPPGSRFSGTNIGLAFSDDAVHWEVEPEPVLDVDRVADQVQPFFANRRVRHEVSRFYDPRLTVIDEIAYLCFAVDTAHGIRGGIASSTDLHAWEFLHLTAPDNRNMVLFPERIGGRYWRLERPFPIYGRSQPEAFDVWISSSMDLRDWSSADLAAGVEDFPFGDRKIGPGAPPVRTAAGWLALTHHVTWHEDRGINGWEPHPWKKSYSIGAVLLDLEDPRRLLGATRSPLLEPQDPCETEGGFRNHVLFPGGVIDEGDGTVSVFYGAADTVECLATGQLDDLVAACEPIRQAEQP